MRLVPFLWILSALALIPAASPASPISAKECAEGGDFIKNAALARENGIAKAKFLKRLEEDIQLIQAFPPQMRWFVQDEDDAQFLINAATEVFELPQDPGAHANKFVQECLVRKPGRRL